MVTSNRLSQPDSQSTGCQTPRYATFNSTKVLICGYPENIVTELSHYIENAGGKVLKKFYKNSRPDFIVCGTVADRSCKEARKTWLDAVPVVTREYVQECAKQAAQVDTRPYKLKPLAGLEVSFTNFPAKDRALLQSMVEQAGGTYSAELFKGRTTHLMCYNGAGKKYSAAVQWRYVHVVSEAWLRESVTLGYPAPEANYKVDPVIQASHEDKGSKAGKADKAEKAAPAGAVPAISEAAMFGSTRRASDDASNKQQPRQQQQTTEPRQVASTRARSTRAATAAAANTEQQAGSRNRRSSQRLSEAPSAAAAAADGPELPHDQAAQAAQSNADARSTALGIINAEAAPMFLERVVLWWCGIPEGSSEHQELQSILHAHAGVRFPYIHDVTTHIMIGVHAKIEDIKAVQQYVSKCNRRVEVVSPAWLQLCQQEQRLVPADNRCRLQLNSLMRAAGAAAGGPGATGIRPAGTQGGVFANTASRGAHVNEPDQQQQAWMPEYWVDQPSDPLKLFDGCYFTLAAVHTHQAEHEKALAHIRRLSGKVFTAESTKPPLQWPKVFAVCPSSLPQEAETALTASDASFRLVHPSCRVTTYWMDMCVKHAELVRVTPRIPMLAPLRFPLPLKDFANISVAVTGYKEGQRSTIEKLVVLLGGTFCKTLGRNQHATHLVLPRWGPDPAPDSNTTSQQQLHESTVKKIAYGLKHKLEMVVSEWLLDCAAEGRRVQEALHRPAGDIQLLELPAAGSTQATAATQLPVTQMHPTQAQAVLQKSRPGSSAAAKQGSKVAGPQPGSRPLVPGFSSTNKHTDVETNAVGVTGAVPTQPAQTWFTANLVHSSATRRSSSQPAPAAPQDAKPPRSHIKGAGHGAAKSPLTSALQVTLSPGGRTSNKKRSAAAAIAAISQPSNRQQAAADTAAMQQADQQQPQQKRLCKLRQEPEQDDCSVGEVPNIKQPSAVQAAETAGTANCSVQAQAVAAAMRTAGAEDSVAQADLQPVHRTGQGNTRVAAADAGTEGQDTALSDMLSMLATITNKDVGTASQAADDPMVSDPLLSAGRLASAGCSSGTGGCGSGAGASGGVQSGAGGLRTRRRGTGLGQAASGGAAEAVTATDRAQSGGAASSAGLGARRLRRSSSVAKPVAGTGPQGTAAAVMAPPARKGTNPETAAVAAGAGSSRYSTRRSSMATAPADVAFEPSQQVGYDVVDDAHKYFATGGSSRAQRSLTGDAQKKAEMLAKVYSLQP